MASFLLPGDAQPANVLAGKRFSAGGNFNVPGTMVDRTAGGIDVLGTAVGTSIGRVYVQPPTGFYNGGNAVYYDDPDFIAANIKAGKDIFGIAGTYNGEETIKNTYSPQAGYVPAVNDLVKFNADGTIRKAVASFVAGSPTQVQVGSGFANDGYVLMMSEDKGIIVSSYIGSTHQHIIVPFSILAGTVTFGAALTLPYYVDKPRLHRLSDNIVALPVTGANAYTPDPKSLALLLYSYVDGVLTYLSTQVLNVGPSSSFMPILVDIIPLDANKFFCSYIRGTSSTTQAHMMGLIFILNANNTITSYTPTQGTTTIQTSTSSMNVHALFTHMLSDGTICAYGKAEGTTNFRWNRYAYDNTTNLITNVTGGAQMTLSGANDSFIPKFQELSGDRVLVTFIAASPATITAYILDGFSPASTLPTGIVVSPSTDGYSEHDIVQIDPNVPNVFLLIRPDIVTPGVWGSILTVGTSDITVSGKALVGTSFPYYRVFSFVRSSPGKFVALQRGGSSSNSLSYLALYAVFNGNFYGGRNDAQDPQGLVTASGNPAQVQLNNGIVPMVTGAPALTLIYCDEFGIPTGSIKDKLIGIVISSTEVFLFGLNSMNDFTIPSLGQVLRTHTVSGTATAGRVVKLNANGTISNYDGNGIPYGIYQGSNTVLLSGVSKAHSGAGFIPSQKYYFDVNGIITTAPQSKKNFIGVARNNTEIMTFGFILERIRD